MMDELINKMDEDAPANAVAHGGVDMNPTGKKKKKDDVGTTADAEDVLRRTIMKKLGTKVLKKRYLKIFQKYTSLKKIKYR